MDFLTDAMASLLALFYSLVPSYSATIVLLTLAVMVVLTPLTLKGTRSMMMMQQLQPEMRKIQNRYKDDRQKLNEELLKFYKENNINPMGGCLPLLAQMPVFFVLYTVLRGLTRRQSDMGYTAGWATGQRGGGATEAPDLMLDFDPAYIEPSTDLYQSLSQVNVMEGPFGLDLSESASQALSQSVAHAIPYFVLIAIVAASGFIQQKQIQGRLPKNQINPQQQMLMKITPIMLPVFSFGLPGGLVLYFAVSNLYRIGQQWFISRSIYGIKRGERLGDGDGSGSGGKARAVTAKVTDESTEDVDDAHKKKGPTPSRAESTKRRQEERSGKAAPNRSKGKPKKASPSSSAKGRATTSKSRTSTNGRASNEGQAPVLQPRARKKKR